MSKPIDLKTVNIFEPLKKKPSSPRNHSSVKELILPFFVSTKMEDDICKKDIIIRTYNGGDHVSIKLNDMTLYDGHVLNIPQDIKQQMVNLLQSRNYDSSILSF